MAEIIDFTERLKKKAKEAESQEYLNRSIACAETRRTSGQCNCKTCVIKKKLAAEIIEYTHEKINQKAKEHNCKLYWGDFVDTLAFSFYVVNTYLKLPPPPPTDEGPKGA